jgi:xylulokinase
LLRSALEGIAHAVALACAAVSACDGPFEQPVMLVGGGTVDPRFRQLIADATGLALAPVAAPDAAVLGAGLLAQSITCNPTSPELGEVITPRESMTAMLAERRDHYLEQVRAQQES